MKAKVLAVIHVGLLMAFLTAAPAMRVCLAQTTYIDQMVRDHINARRFEERLRERRTGKTKAAAKSKAAAPRRATGLIELSRDLYNGDAEEATWTLEVTLTPQQNATKIVRRFPMGKDRPSPQITGVPPGRYLLTAREVASGGAAKTVYVGAETHSSPTEPKKHGLGSSLNITLAAPSTGTARAHVWFAR